MTFRPDFALTEFGHAHPARIARSAMRDEARRELAHRRAAYPRMIVKGQTTEAEADRRIVMMAAIAGDLARLIDTGHATTHAENPFTWTDKVHELRREIGLRRRFYPDWVKKGMLTPAAARAQLAALLGIHWLYWVDGLFTPPGFATAEHIRTLDLTHPDWRGPHPDVVPGLTTATAAA